MNRASLPSPSKPVIAVMIAVSCLTAAAQPPSNTSNHFVGLSYSFAKVEVHSQHVQNLNGTYPKGVSLNFGQHDFSKRALNTYGCNIRFGGMLHYWQFNNKILGRGLSAMAYAEPFIHSFDRYMLSIKAGIGIIGLSKPYNITNNPNNQAYSTTLSFPLSLGLAMYFPVSPKWAIVLNGNLNHFSNGGIKKPNYGLNFPSVSLGLEHSFNHYGVPPRTFNRNVTLSSTENRRQITTALSLSMEEAGSPPHKEPIVILNAHYHYRLSRINGIGAGILTEAYVTQSNKNALSALAGHRFYLGRFSFTQDLGVYIIDNNASNPLLFQFYSLQKQIADHVVLGINLKAHSFTAQHIGLRIGWLW